MKEIEDPESLLEKTDINIFKLIFSGIIWPIWVIYFLVVFIKEVIRLVKGENNET